MKTINAVNDNVQIPARFVLRANHKLDEPALSKLAALLHTLESNPDEVDALRDIQDSGLYLGLAENFEDFRKLLAPATAIEPLTQDETNELQQCETVIEHGQKAFLEVANALAAIIEKKLYRARFETFDLYCKVRWNWKRQRAYQLIRAAEISRDLSTVVDKPETEASLTVVEATVMESKEVSPTDDIAADLEPKKSTTAAKPPPRSTSGRAAIPTSERQLRPLTKLPRSERADAWKEACEQSAGKPTGKVVEQTVKRRLQKSEPEPKSAKPASEAPLLTVLVCKDRKDIPPERLNVPNLLLIEITRIRAFVEMFWPEAVKISPGWKEREGWQC